FTAPLKVQAMGIGISSPSSDYEMEHYLGSGAYGAVVQSKKLTTNETVALKVIKNERYMERIWCLFAPVTG
uniref:Protein kinase domain-containing protein n=1 Tax=Xiphophorus couchianus TaxID=32473 RepID=A0A3B5KZY3_9TELE